MGTPAEFKAMIRFFEEHQLIPIIEKEFNLSDILQAKEHLVTGGHFGKVVLEIP